MKPQAYSYLRMSTDLQLKGDSRRRQLEASRTYAETHGLELAAGSEMEDIGVSAFKGANVRGGALGRFLEAVQTGRVKPGSYLLVESLDRLSRQQLLAAQSLFLSIVQAGINVVTLADGRVYPAGTNDLADLIVSLVIMSRAHEESQIKSHRLTAAWKNKRTSATALRPMTRWCPAWLQLAPDRSCYLPIPERVEIVRQIFSDSANGIGIFRIASRLNAAAIATFNKSDGWHQSYVAKILSNRAVLGEFQPGTRKDGKRVVEGDPIQNYFPRIIDDELFYRAKLGKLERLQNGAGRKGTAFTNLFSGLATCAYCKSQMVYENKGRGPKGGNYLVCSKVKRKDSCSAVRWKYEDFETSFLAFVREIDLSHIMDGGAEDEYRRITREISALEGELVNNAELMNKTYSLLEEGAPAKFISSKLNDLQRRQETLEQEIASKTEQLKTSKTNATRFSQSNTEIKKLITRLQSTDIEGSFELRAKIASHLRSLIITLQVGTKGGSLHNTKAADWAETQVGEEAKDVVGYLRSVAKAPEQSRRYFVVGFKDGRVRGVYPSDNNPLSYRQQVLAAPSVGITIIDEEQADPG